MVVLPVSEILPIRGAELLGTFPGDTQSYIVMVAGTAAAAKAGSGAKALTDFLMAPGALSVLRAKGMEREPKPAGRTPDGHPDLQGTWTNYDQTPFERLNRGEERPRELGSVPSSQ